MKKAFLLAMTVLFGLHQRAYSISDHFAAIGTGIASGIVSGGLYYAGVPSYVAPIAPYVAIACLSKNTTKKIRRPGVMITAASITGALVAGCRGVSDVFAFSDSNPAPFSPTNSAQFTMDFAGGLITLLAVIPAMYAFNAITYTIGSLIPSLVTYGIWDSVTQ